MCECGCGCDWLKTEVRAKVRAEWFLRCGRACAARGNLSQPNVCIKQILFYVQVFSYINPEFHQFLWGAFWVIRTYIFKHFTFQVRVINSHKTRSLDTNLVKKVLTWDVCINKNISEKKLKKLPDRTWSPVESYILGWITLLSNWLWERIMSRSAHFVKMKLV